MLRVKLLGLVLAILILGVALGQGLVYLNDVTKIDETPFEFRITVYEFWGNTTHYSNEPPILGGSSIMFFDALTGLVVVEVAPRITVEQLYHPKPK